MTRLHMHCLIADPFSRRYQAVHSVHSPFECHDLGVEEVLIRLYSYLYAYLENRLLFQSRWDLLFVPSIRISTVLPIS